MVAKAIVLATRITPLLVVRARARVCAVLTISIYFFVFFFLLTLIPTSFSRLLFYINYIPTTNDCIIGGHVNINQAQKSVIAGGRNNMFMVPEDGLATANEYCAISGGRENGPFTHLSHIFSGAFATRASVITGGVENVLAGTQQNPQVRTY